MTQQPAPSLHYHYQGTDEAGLPAFDHEVRLGNQSVLVDNEEFAQTICSAAAIFPRILDEDFDLQRYTAHLLTCRTWTPEAPVTSEALDNLQEVLDALGGISRFVPEFSAATQCSFDGHFELRNRLIALVRAAEKMTSDLETFIDDARERLALESAA